MEGPRPKSTEQRAKGRRHAVAPTLVVTGALALLYVASGFSRTVITQQSPPQPTFRTEANYVRVDVYPTKDGAPVGDLMPADFEVLESGAAQKIEQFEHVVIRGNVLQDLRAEPNTVEQARQAAQNPRARVFVLFLDINHVSVDGSRRIRGPLVAALDRLIAPDDVVAVMTPEMSAKDITFARRTTTINGILSRYWNWGERDRVSFDPQEEQYMVCYPGHPPMTCPDGGQADDRGVADALIERRREMLTLDALTDLVRYLRGVREERKAVLAITEGWRLFRPDEVLEHKRVFCEPPIPQVGIDPRTGKLTGKTPPTLFNSNPDSCERDRSTIARANDEQTFRNLIDEANRGNTSFYPIDPRGLAVFDEPIDKVITGLPPAGATTLTPLPVDAARLRGRLDSLRTLGEGTDGLAIVNTNDLARGLKRVVDDLSSYYLLAYYSNGRLDGRFHPITVRVKRPGVQVRARRGYLAATPAAMTATAGRGGVPAPKALDAAAEAEAHAIEAAIAPLAGYARDVPLRLQLAAGWKPANVTSAAIWIVGEIGGVAAIGDAWNDGFDATATMTTPADATVASGRVTVPRGGRTFRMALTSSGPLASGEYVLRVGARAAAGTASIPSRETARLTIPPAPESVGAIFVRRALATGNKDTPTADLRFRRNEQVRVEVPADSADSVGARLLDRAGKALAVPVIAGVRDDADGSRWQTAQLALAPLAPGDYVIEISSGNRKTMSAFRVIP